MAYLGMQYPIIAQYDKSAGTYSNGFTCGEAVKVNVTPNYVEGSLYGDNKQVEYEKNFKNANVSLGVTTLPIEAASVMFGHTVDTTDNAITYAASDEANYVGVGFVTDKTDNGTKTYEANILYCVKFSEAAVDYQTKGESITFSTPTVEGLAIADASDNWKMVQEFSTAAAALAFINTAFGITTT